MSNDIVISGISCRFPKGPSNTNEFKRNLFSGVKISTDGAQIKLDRFDAAFFGLKPSEAQTLDSQVLLLLELTYEAIYDSGTTPLSLRGSITGVYSNLKQSFKRIASTFDFRGPSCVHNCPVQAAFEAIKADQCNAAIVAESNGGEAIVLYMQREEEAKRVYTTVLGVKNIVCNQAYKQVYSDLGVDPLSVSYLEIGCDKEMEDLVKVLCKDRDGVLLLGRSATGGLHGLLKSIFVMETGKIPTSSDFPVNSPVLELEKVKVVCENQAWIEGLIGLSLPNTHLILKPNSKSKKRYPSEFLRVVGVSARTKEAATTFLDYIRDNWDDEEFLALVDNLHDGHLYRGYTILGSPSREVSLSSAKPIWFVYAGMGSQWPSMAKDLMQIIPFQASIEQSVRILEPYGVDLKGILLRSSENTFKSIVNSFVGITSVQLALTDVMKTLGIEPDGVTGHSVGEVVCSYVDGSLTAEQVLLTSYHRAKVIEEGTLHGTMAVMGVSWEEAKRLCPPDLFLGCHNSQSNVTVSGPSAAITRFVRTLTAKKIVAMEIDSSGIPFHCQYMATVGERMKEALREIIPNPKLRSSKWISSSVPQSDWAKNLALYSSPDYHTNNLLSPVLFYEAMQHIPKEALVVEVAPTGLLQTFLKRTVGPKAMVMSLILKENNNKRQFFAEALGKLYNAGVDVKLGNLYSPVDFPVGRGTAMISPAIQWKHGPY